MAATARVSVIKPRLLCRPSSAELGSGHQKPKAEGAQPRLAKSWRGPQPTLETPSGRLLEADGEASQSRGASSRAEKLSVGPQELGNRLPPSPSPPPNQPAGNRFPPCPGSEPGRLRGALLPQSQRLGQSGYGNPCEGAFSKVKTRLVGTWGFFPAQHRLCNRIVKDHGRGRKSEQPHRSARGRIYFTAPNTLRQTRDFRGGGDAEFQDAGMWQKQNPPHPCTLSSDLVGGSSGTPSSRLQRSSGFFLPELG